MFIRDNIKFQEITYKLNEEEIHNVFKKLKSNDKTYIGVVESQDSFTDKSFWIQKANEFNIDIVFLKEYFFHTEDEERFFIVFKNNSEYQTAIRLYSYISEHFHSFYSEEVLGYLIRNNIVLLKEQDGFLKDVKTNQIISKSPVVPVSNNIIVGLSEMLKKTPELTDFDSLVTCENSDFINKWFAQYSFSYTSDKEDSLKIDLCELIEWNKLSPMEIHRLKEEISFLRLYNHDILFWISSKVKNEQITFKGCFRHFLLSKLLKLNNNIADNYFSPLDTKIFDEPFVFQSSSLTKFTTLLTMKSVMSEYDLHIKHPISSERPLFASLLSLFMFETNNKESMLQKLNIKKLMKYKDKLDDFLEDGFEGAKEKFYQDTKLYFLINQEEEKAFEFALNVLNENFFHSKCDYDKNIIFNKHTISNKGETVFIDVQDARKFNLPIIVWENKKTPFND